MLRHKFVVKSKLFNHNNSKKHLLQKVLCKYLTKDCLINRVADDKPQYSDKKVSIIGCGSVGLGVAISLLAQKISNDICLIDPQKERIEAEKWDLEQGSLYMHNAKIQASSDYAATAHSNICIIPAGVRGRTDENRLALLQKNVELYKKIIPTLIKHSPKTKLVIISNPVDVMTYVAWKLSGLPLNRVLGTGTTLDTARFRFFIAQRLGIAPTSVHAIVIGEHGDSSVPVWSTVNVMGSPLAKLHPKIGAKDDEEKWGDLHTDVVKAAYKIIHGKGFTNWSIGVVGGAVCSAILENDNTAFPVSTNACGFYGINKDVFLSLPCILNANGVHGVVRQTLSDKETELLYKSAEILSKAQESVKL